MEEAEEPVAPDGFHYPNQVPKLLPNGKTTVLCRYIADEKSMTRKEKYRHMFYDHGDNENGKSVMLQCVCGASIVCLKYVGPRLGSDGGYDIGNMFRHIQAKHPFEITYADARKNINHKGMC
jgi:hypothetical protein